MLRDFAIALSLTNLYFFSVWADLLPGAPAHYFMQLPPPRIAFAVAAANVLIGAVILCSAVQLVRRMNHPMASTVARLAFLAMLAIALNGLRRKIPIVLPAGMADLMGTSAMLGLTTTFVVSAGVALLWWRRALRLAIALVLVMAPFTAVTLGRACWTWVRYDSAFADFASPAPAPAVPSDGSSQRRVLWLVFDELDEGLAFEDRPASVDLPDLDRFSNESIRAVNAYPPANDTLRSMPALITGKSVVDARPARANDLELRFVESPATVLWSGQENVFSRARSGGVNSGLIGSYHPYCRVIGNVLTTCTWQQWRRSVWSEASQIMLDQNLQVLEAIPSAKRIGLSQSLRTLVANWRGASRRDRAIQAYEAALADVKRMVNRTDLGLIFVHLPVPHSPYIYRRATGEFASSGYSSYFDNLALADRCFGEIRRAMEAAATWETTSILVTADHGYRAELWHDKLASDAEETRAAMGSADGRVPFILKIAGQTEPARFAPRLNTVAAHDLVLALLRGEVTDVTGALHWLNAQAESVPATERS